MSNTDDTISVINALMFLEWRTLAEISEKSGVGPRKAKKVINKLMGDGDVIRKGHSYKYPNGDD